MKIGSYVETIRGNTGWVIDFHSGDPVVYFPNMGKFAKIIRADCFERIVEDVYGIHPRVKLTGKKKVAAFKMPLAYGLLIGFQPLVADYYQFEPKVAGRKYPWDKGSVWKVVESSGQKFLVREAQTGTNITNSHPLENDGASADSATGESPILDTHEDSKDKAYV